MPFAFWAEPSVLCRGFGSALAAQELARGNVNGTSSDFLHGCYKCFALCGGIIATLRALTAVQAASKWS